VKAADPRLYIDSQAHEEGPKLDVRDPWTGELLASIVLADSARAERAVVASVDAFQKLAKLPAYRRRDALQAVSRGIDERQSELAELIARESGKPIASARAEVLRAVSTFALGAEEATRLNGEVMPLDISAAGTDTLGEWVRVPAGPVIGIAPFNFPLNLVAHKVAPALACGCSIILKPPPQAPLTSLALAAIVRSAFPVDNALQVVPCEVDVAEALVRDARFATLSFTGSAKVGWHLKAIAGNKHVLLELGGNAAAIVHEDADRARAAPRIVAGAFGYAGQVCIKVQRLYVHRSIARVFVADVVKRVSALAPLSPLDDKTVMGPLIDEANARRVEEWVREAVQAGARPLTEVRREKNRLTPVVLEIEGSGTRMKVVDEEVFGPVLTVHTYDTWDEALEKADATRYGLQAGIFTDSHARIREAFARLHVGAVIVNDVPTFRVDSMPYGGTRDSGMGREGVRFAIEEMTERKLLVLRG
jgi:acyl-CoA reductase-like NAD-dependent aldehyde dehydrogenase